jgi:hypothetical protein
LAFVVMVHAVFAAMAAVAAVYVMAAVAWPLFATLVVKVVVPQPVFVGASVPVSVHEGSVITILSLTPSATLRLKETATVVFVAGAGVASTIDVPENAEAAAVAVDDAMEVADTDPAANVPPIVYPAKLAATAAAGDVAMLA